MRQLWSTGWKEKWLNRSTMREWSDDPPHQYYPLYNLGARSLSPDLNTKRIETLIMYETCNWFMTVLSYVTPSLTCGRGTGGWLRPRRASGCTCWATAAGRSRRSHPENWTCGSLVKTKNALHTWMNECLTTSLHTYSSLKLNIRFPVRNKESITHMNEWMNECLTTSLHTYSSLKLNIWFTVRNKESITHILITKTEHMEGRKCFI